MQHSLRFSYAPTVILFVALLALLPRASFAAQINISITDNGYVPSSVTIAPEDTVQWLNNGSNQHTVTADDGSFDSVTLSHGQTFTAQFHSVGPYAYHCKIHGSAGGAFSGVVQVVAPAPVVTSSNNSMVSQMQAQVQALIDKVNALRAQASAGIANYVGTGVVSNSSACPNIGRVLKKGISGDDVSRLQQFLARDPSVYPEGTVSGYYGALTERAVQRWQAKYNVVSSGSPATTGYGVVGPRTAAAIALLCSTGSYGSVPAQNYNTNTTPQVGALLTVTPISGNAPLDVKVVASVNTTASCQAATYTLDFGDNSLTVQIPVMAGVCQQSDKSFTHTYKYGGVYTVTLSALGRQTTATVTVDGPPPPVITPGLPQETFNVNPLSGAAPLTVTFSGVVNSNDAGFCTDGCASVLDFGDGNQANVNLPGSVGGWINYSLTHTYTQSGGFRATLYQGGAGASQPIVGSATVVVGFPAPQQPTTTITPATTTVTGTTGSYAFNLPVVTPSGSDPLAYAIVDEQHRFGTRQRRELAQKNNLPSGQAGKMSAEDRVRSEASPAGRNFARLAAPHFLSMTATPIPRTLSLTLYGDLDLSLLDELPPGRAKIATKIVKPDKRKDAYEAVRAELLKGRQAYVICPRIEEPDPTKINALQAKSAKAEAKRLKADVFQEYEIGLLHGAMKPAEKDAVMQRFTEGAIHVLVATSVVEVGVNVPNATAIMIEGAERFGLAQLHQLRGRVMRSSHPPICFLLTDSRSDISLKRLRTLEASDDGFKLAEADLANRGAGDLFGRQQWGVSDLGMEALKNPRLIKAARDEAQRLIASDPQLSQHPALAERVANSVRELHSE